MTGIPTYIWNQKKALITRLYQDEEWPLKQVIKRVRSDNFNPRETQLRSRLKKWRVTKPSRQTRKQPNATIVRKDSGQEKRLLSCQSKPQGGDIASKVSPEPLSVLTMHMTEVPIKDMETYVCRSTKERHKEKRKDGKIPRPMNAFMLYRSAYADRMKAWFAQHSPRLVSVAAGISWNNETDKIKQKYVDLASLEKSNHLKAHPGYKWNPFEVKKKRSGLNSDHSILGDHQSTSSGSPALHTTPFSSLTIDSNGWNSEHSALPEMMDHGLPTDYPSSWLTSNSTRPLLRPMLSPMIDSNGWNSEHSALPEMMDHGLPTDYPSSWLTSNSTRPLLGPMLSPPPPQYKHGIFAYVDNTGIRRADMDGMQLTSTTLAWLPGATQHDVLQDQAQPPTLESGQHDPQMLGFLGCSTPDAGSHIYGNSYFPRWQESADNSYVPFTAPTLVPYTDALAFQPGVQTLVDSRQAWTMDAAGDQFNQSRTVLSDCSF